MKVLQILSPSPLPSPVKGEGERVTYLLLLQSLF
jgi:hypothetical protein